uniref:ORF76 n=1 Tax=Sargassum graminifolium TaxID=2855562 RepID=A0A8F4XJL0_9PHAE|nr:ORF76 [Sargassum graminifolium]QXI87214.1 ORF76 [Sargassum graminifolium]
MLSQLKEFFFDVYWIEIILFFSFLGLGFLVEQKFNIKEPRKWFIKFNGIILQRILSLFCYYIPYLDIINTHLPLIEETHPYIVRLFLPTFIIGSLQFIQQIPFLPFIYLMLGYGIFIRNKLPKDRFIRYNIMYGIIIISFQGIIHELFLNITKVFCLNSKDRSEAALLTFLGWILIFIPCFIRAILGKYESNPFLREAIEVHLGRDGPDFVWWDRQKKPEK